MKGSVAFLVFGKTLFFFFFPLSCCSAFPGQPEQSRGDASPQLPAQGTRCNF